MAQRAIPDQKILPNLFVLLRPKYKVFSIETFALTT
jgi:hypothetical protein